MCFPPSQKFPKTANFNNQSDFQYQFSFREKRDTIGQVHRIVSEVRSAVQGIEYYLAIFLEVTSNIFAGNFKVVSPGA